MVIRFVITCLIPFFVGAALTPLTSLTYLRMSCCVFLILWAFLSFLLRRKCKKTWIVVLAIHSPGLILLITEPLRVLLAQQNSINALLQAYVLPSLSVASWLFSRLFYLLFGTVTFEVLSIGALAVMMTVSFIGCLISKKIAGIK